MTKAVVILPKHKVFDAVKMRSVITSTLNAQAKAIKVDFDVTTQTWKAERRPKFQITSPSEYTREIATDNDVYFMLNVGTKRHTISARNKPFLVFKWQGFRSKTIPNEIRSRKGAQGKQWVRKLSVEHPGTKPRLWTKAIKKKWDAQIGVTFQRAIDAAAS
jgi:hypothetical protein